jgi:hypothetical protein
MNVCGTDTVCRDGNVVDSLFYLEDDDLEVKLLQWESAALGRRVDEA